MIAVATRRDFLKLLGMATACTIVQPAFAAEAIAAPAKPVIKAALKRAAHFKVTGAMLKNTDIFKICIDDFCRHLSDGDPLWEKKTTILVAYDGDDFAMDCRTVLITYTP